MFRGPNDTVGHFASVQMGFVESAQVMGERFVIFDGKFFWENSSENQLDTIAQVEEEKNIYEGIDKWLQDFPTLENVTVMVFEGSLGTIKEVSEFARSWPDNRIYINLFYPEPGLSIPGTYDHFVGEITDDKLHILLQEVKKILDELPNLRLACDTDARSYLARSLGIRIDATWHGRSPVGLISKKYLTLEQPSKSDKENIEILITVDITRFKQMQFLWCVQVIRFVSSISMNQDRKIEWTFNFLPKEVSYKFRFLIRFLPRKNVHFVQSKVDLDMYAQRIHSANLIWLPLSSYYISSSSGRVADAVSLRKPILVPSGTYGHFEISKWIQNWPTYRSQFECAQIILNMQNLLPFADILLKNQAESISQYYSNENQLKKVIGSKINSSSEGYDFAKNIANTGINDLKNNITIFTFAKSLAYSLSPNFYVRLLNLVMIGFSRKFLNIFKK